MQYQIPQIRPQLDQGATIQPTSPIPPVGQPDLARYAQMADMRYRTNEAPPEIHQGATIQPTAPIPPVSQPEFAYYRADRDLNRAWLNVGPRPQLDQGATVQPTYPVPPVSQPERAQYELLANAARNQPAAYKDFQGATVQPTQPVPPVGQPDLARYAQMADVRYRAAPVPQFTGPGIAVQQTHPVPPVAQPERAPYEALLNAARNQPAAYKDFQGATIQPTAPIPPVSQPERAQYELLANAARNQPQAYKDFQGATIQPTQPVPPVSQPEWSYYRPDRDLNRSWTGAGPRPQFEGATVQQTYLFPPNQPDPAQFLALRNSITYRAELVKRFEGAPVIAAQTYLFPPDQPQPAQILALNYSRSFLVDTPFWRQLWIVFPTPAWRVFTVAAEPRIFTVASEPRVFTVAAESRIFTVTTQQITPFHVIKDPNGDLDYQMDWTPWLGTDTISTSTWTAPPGCQIITHDSVVDGTGKKTTIWLKGGKLGGPYLVSNQVTTSGARVEPRSLSVTIQVR